MRIEIRLTEHCNYDCSYCTDMHNNSAKNWKIDYNGLSKVLLQFNDIDFFIYGGEPTLSDQLIELVSFLKNYSNNIIVQTNGSNPDILKDLDIKINYSYHNGQILKDFVKRVDTKKLNEIAYMDHDDANYTEYKHLKILYKDRVQFCPTINSKVGEAPSTQLLKDLETKDIFKTFNTFNTLTEEHFVDNGYQSNWFNWANDIESINKPCSTEFSTIHIQNNKVYNCFNSMIQDKYSSTFDEYDFEPKIIKCPHKYCYFGMENWV